MTSMLEAYRASVSMLQEYKLAMGNISASARETEFRHLSRLFRNEAPSVRNRTEITDTIKHIRTDASDTFSPAQRTSLIEVATASMKGDDLGEVDMNSLHGGQKSQTHLFSYNYYEEDDWEYFSSDQHTMKEKFKRMSKAWLKWGLKFPSGPTFRVGVATVCASSKKTWNRSMPTTCSKNLLGNFDHFGHYIHQHHLSKHILLMSKSS